MVSHSLMSGSKEENLLLVRVFSLKKCVLYLHFNPSGNISHKKNVLFYRPPRILVVSICAFYTH